MIDRFISTKKLVVRSGLFALLIVMVNLGVSTHQKRVEAEDSITSVALHFDVYSSGFSIISSMDFTDDGRMFVADILGRVGIVEIEGAINPTLFLDLVGVVGTNGKQALSGFVLHPDFESNGIFYVNYTTGDNLTFLSRFHTLDSDPDQADPNSEEVMMTYVQPTNVHNRAGMMFGPDGSFTLASSGKISGGNVSTFGQGPDGELFVAAGYKIHRISAETVTLYPQAYIPTIYYNEPPDD